MVPVSLVMRLRSTGCSWGEVSNVVQSLLLVSTKILEPLHPCLSVLIKIIPLEAFSNLVKYVNLKNMIESLEQ